MVRRVLLFCLLLPLCAGAELTLSIEPRWHGVALAIPATAPVQSGEIPIRITRLAALLSSVVLHRADGSSVRLDGQQGFINAEQHRLDWTLMGVPEGDYVGFEFEVGVPEALNHGDPGVWPAGHALNPLVNSLHWNWQGGYVFLALEGHWRPAGGEGSAKVESGFSYHLATDSRRTPVRFRADFSVQGRTDVMLALELSRMIDAAQLGKSSGNESTHSGPGDELAPRMAAALGRSWFWLEAKHREATKAVVSAATRDDVFDPGPSLAFVVPAGFPQPELPKDNALTRAGVALGQRLFEDKRLARNQQQSCATCHDPQHAFSDTVALSLGADGEKGRRNSMPLLNLAWSPAFAWDGSKPRIRDQALAAMINPVEMHADVAQVTAVLEQDAAIRAGFAAAFGTPEITAVRIGLALEQYLLTLVSCDAKFDQVARGQAHFTEAEQRGFNLFLMEYDPAHGRRGADCFHCHGGLLFSDFGYKSNGLKTTTDDRGRGAVTEQLLDSGRFKTPSLRNVAVTAPYMHDGRFATLEDVVAHYDHAVERTASLDPNLAKHPATGLTLSAEDQAALVAFLTTLTDQRWMPTTGPSGAGVAAR